MAALILIFAAAAMAFVAASPPASAQPTARTQPLTPKFSTAEGFRKEAWSVWYVTQYGQIQGPARSPRVPSVVPLENAAADNPDVLITTATDRTLTENSIAVHPLDNSTLFCANNATDWDGTQVNTIFGTQVGWSLDGGLTWTSQNEGPGGVGNRGDPAAAIDRSGKFYVGYIANDKGQGVSYSNDTGATWTHVTIAPGPPGFFDLLDKNHFAVDKVATSAFVGQAYSAWTEFISGGANDKDIVFSRSLDGGATWSAGVNISNGVAAGSHNQGVNLQIGPNGEIYATWAIYDAFPADENAIGFNSSVDGGATWTGETRIITNIRGIRNTPLPNTTIRRASFPSMAVDASGGPRNGSIYIVWTNVGVPGVNTGDADIYLIGSTDQGATWSTPVRVNTDATTNSQWFPWVSSDSLTGEPSVIFYDRRDDPANTLTTTYVAHSTDGGSTWTNLRVGDVQFTPTPIPGNIAAGYMGDYLGIACRECQVFPIWSDDRTSFYTAYVSPVLFDETPPTITGVSANPSVLWPPNHRLVDVIVDYNVTDNCPSPPDCTLSVTSNEPVLGHGSGHTSPDWIVVDDHHVLLRAERQGNGNGRIYTTTITCTDSGGNSSTEEVEVTVPHDRGRR